MGKLRSDQILLGTQGQQRVATLQNLGSSRKAAVGRTVAEQFLVAGGAMAASALYVYVKNK